MAGSYRHLVDHNNIPYDVSRWTLIDNLGDAIEALDELFAMVQYLSGGDREKIHQAWREGYCKHNIPPENYADDRLTGFAAFWADNDA